MCDLSIIVVSYNTRDMTLECLRSVFEQTHGIAFEILVVDNDSRDSSAIAIADEFGDRVTLIALEDNIGFAAANNLAATRAKGEYLLLLNPDTIVLQQALLKLLKFAKEYPDAGVWGGRTVFADRSLNIASCWMSMTPWSLLCSAIGLTSMFPNSELFNSEGIGGWRRDSIRRVDIVVGCLLMIRKALWQQLNGFNVKYWMYGEEADLCLRAQRLGYRPMVTPEAEIVHYVGASSGTSARKTPLVAKAKATLIRDHWSRRSQGLGIKLLWLWVAVRRFGTAVLAYLNPVRYKSAAETWFIVWNQRHDWLAGYRESTVAAIVPREASHLTKHPQSTKG